MTQNSLIETSKVKNPARKIIHIDMDCFFVAIEMRDNPRLDPEAPIAVGGRPEGRGVISTCNYPARKFGVRSALSTREAIKRCPQLILIPSHFESYRKESRAIYKIFREYTPLVEPLSLDEAFLDVSDTSLFDGVATRIAQDIRQKIYNERSLTASAGIAPNKFLAKIASDLNKPNGQKTIPPKDITSFIYNLPVEKINGVGKATKKKLYEHQIFTCGDIQKKNPQYLNQYFGNWGSRLYELSFGKDTRPVTINYIRKSLSVERTFSDDLYDWEEIKKKFLKVYELFCKRWDNSKISPSRIKSCHIKVKYFDFESMTREQHSKDILTKDVWLKKMYDIHQDNPKAIRLLGLGVKLESPKKRKSNGIQLDLFSET